MVGNMQRNASSRLSSGFRINSAADDAAGLGISEKMRGQIRGLDQASRNAQDGISLIQTAEGAMSTINEMVIRIRELTVQAANDTNAHEDDNLAQSDRMRIQDEINQLMDEIDATRNRTQFNTRNLIDGSLSRGTGAAGGAVRPNLIQAGDINFAALGTGHGIVPGDIDMDDLIDALNSLFTSHGGDVPFNVGIHGANWDDVNGMFDDLFSAFGIDNSAADWNDDDVRAVANWFNANRNMFLNILSGPTPQEGLQLQNLDLRNIGGIDPAGIDVDDLIDALEDVAFRPFLRYGIDATNFDHTDLDDFWSAFGDPTMPALTDPSDWTAARASGDYDDFFAVVDWFNRVRGGILNVIEGGVGGARDGSGLWFQIGANVDQGVRLTIEDVGTAALSAIGASGQRAAEIGNFTFDRLRTIPSQNLNHGPGGAPIHDAAGGVVNISGEDIQRFITAIDEALAHVTGQRSNLGAMQNRLEFTIENLDIASENLSAAESRIRDADMAREMMRLTQANVLQQAATAMLAQANQAPQSVLQLLG